MIEGGNRDSKPLKESKTWKKGKLGYRKRKRRRPWRKKVQERLGYPSSNVCKEEGG